MAKLSRINRSPARKVGANPRAKGPVHASTQLSQRGVGSIRQQLLQPLFAFLGQQRATPAPVRPWLQRTALPKLLAHAAYRRYAKTEKLGNLASALAPSIELNNPLTHGDRDGFHSHILCHIIGFLKSYIIYGCLSSIILSPHNGYVKMSPLWDRGHLH